MANVNSLQPNNNDDQSAQQTSLAAQFPNSVDALAGMQYPDFGGGPITNGPFTPSQRAHPATKIQPPTPQSLGMPAYGTQLNEGTSFQVSSQE